MTDGTGTRQYTYVPVGSLGALLAESERAGFRFVSRLVDEWVSGANRFDRSGEALFAAWVDGQVAGVCGLNIDPYSADGRVGRVRHLYVLAELRRHGIGRQLVAEVVRAAQSGFDILRLRTGNPSAARFYEALGFRPVGALVNGATHFIELAACAPNFAVHRTGGSRCSPSGR